MTPEMITALDEYRKYEPTLPTRPEAIRQILDRTLRGGLLNAGPDTDLDFFFAELLERVRDHKIDVKDACGRINEVVAILDKDGAHMAVITAKAQLTD